MMEEEIEISDEEIEALERELLGGSEERAERPSKAPSRTSAARTGAITATTVKKHRAEIVRVSTGVPELDRALEGGIPKGSWVAITGEPGTGKSILCMHFAWAGLQAGDPVVYVTTEAEFRDVVRQARQFGMDFENFRIHDISSREEPGEPPQIVVIDIFGLLKIARQMSEFASDTEAARKRRFAALDVQTLVAAIREAYRILGVLRSEKSKVPYRHVRLIIDSISAFWADKPAMARKYSYELKVATHRENVTAYLVSQYAMTTKSTFGFGLEHIADGVIHLWMDDVEKVKEVRRYLIIKKMRMTNHARHAYRVEIDPSKGFKLLPLDTS